MRFLFLEATARTPTHTHTHTHTHHYAPHRTAAQHNKTQGNNIEQRNTIQSKAKLSKQHNAKQLKASRLATNMAQQITTTTQNTTHSINIPPQTRKRDLESMTRGQLSNENTSTPRLMTCCGFAVQAPPHASARSTIPT